MPRKNLISILPRLTKKVQAPPGYESSKIIENLYLYIWIYRYFFRRFAFAETNCEEEIQKAIKTMDSKEIHGRRLRVRSSKDKDRNDKAEQK